MWHWRPSVRIRLSTPFDSLAQSAEHLTFNQGVRSSNLRWVTNQKPLLSYDKRGFLNDVCYANDDVLLMMFASLMMSASPNVLWQTSHHCEYNEQHHYSKNNIISLKAMHHYVLSSPLRAIWVVFYFVRRGPQPSKSRVRDGTAIRTQSVRIVVNRVRGLLRISAGQRGVIFVRRGPQPKKTKL